MEKSVQKSEGIPSGMLIGEVCRRIGCTARTIRHYEDEGLLTPLAVTPGGRKLYGDDVVAIVRLAQVLQRIGYSIKDIRSILALAHSPKTQDRQLTLKLRRMLSDSAGRIDGEIEILQTAKGKIASLLEKTHKCDGCHASDCAPCGKLKDLRTLGLLA